MGTLGRRSRAAPARRTLALPPHAMATMQLAASCVARPVAAPAKRAAALAPAKALGGVPLAVKPRARVVVKAAAASASMKETAAQARRAARSSAAAPAVASRRHTLR